MHHAWFVTIHPCGKTWVALFLLRSWKIAYRSVGLYSLPREYASPKQSTNMYAILPVHRCKAVPGAKLRYGSALPKSFIAPSRFFRWWRRAWFLSLSFRHASPVLTSAMTLMFSATATAAELATTLLVRSERVAPGATLRIDLVAMNPSTVDLPFNPPGEITAHMRAASRSWPTTLEADGATPTYVLSRGFASRAYHLAIRGKRPAR